MINIIKTSLDYFFPLRFQCSVCSFGSAVPTDNVTHTGDLIQCGKCGSNIKPIGRAASFKNIFIFLLIIFALIDSWRLAVVVILVIFGIKYFSKFLNWIGIH